MEFSRSARVRVKHRLERPVLQNSTAYDVEVDVIPGEPVSRTA
jgi:hypothetical protein